MRPDVLKCGRLIALPRVDGDDPQFTSCGLPKGHDGGPAACVPEEALREEPPRERGWFNRTNAIASALKKGRIPPRGDF